MTIDVFLRAAVRPALGLLPAPMDSAEARAMIVAIALQESRLTHRRQVDGPARSFLQFERAGLRGVLEHPQTRTYAEALCVALAIAPTLEAVYEAVTFQDVLAAGFARLALWTSPQALPSVDHTGDGWGLYLSTWRPGRPRRESWDGCFEHAWAGVVPGLEPSRHT